MRNVYERLKNIWISWLGSVVVVAGGVLLLLSGSSMAELLNQEKFASPDEACRALYSAVESGNAGAIGKVLGGGDDLVSSGDLEEDRHDRELFLNKYRQMHRLVHEPDGTILLYIGAENWPFPVPLISKKGKWFFDTDAGTQEIIFRRVGENEAETVRVCKRLAGIAKRKAPSEDAISDPAFEYAQKRIEAEVSSAGEHQITPVQSGRPVNGYYFRRLEKAPGTAGSESPFAMAYPADYQSSGVMTFVVTQEGKVYEKDLGELTSSRAIGMKSWKLDGSWSAVY